MPILVAKSIVFFQHPSIVTEGICRLELAVRNEVGISLHQPFSRRGDWIIPRIYSHLAGRIGSSLVKKACCEMGPKRSPIRPIKTRGLKCAISPSSDL